jgi:imidazolonepropionase-like amidohydrolase
MLTLPGIMRPPRVSTLLAAVVLAAAPAGSIAAQPSAPAVLAFTHATVIDVERGRADQDMTVVVAGNRIAAVGTSATVRAPAGTRVVDATGKVIIPGLWDMHVHATGSFIDKVFLPMLVANGITGVREMFSQSAWVDSSRAAVRAGAFAGPRIVASGHILDGAPPIWPGSVVAKNADEGRRTVDSLQKTGADFIKVYSRLSREAYFAIAAEAKRVGIPFAGHVPTLVAAGEASDAGQKSIEHLTGVLGACSSRDRDFRDAIGAAVASPKGWDSAAVVSRHQMRALLDSFDAARCRELARTLVKNGTWMVPTIAVLRSTAYLDDTTLAADPRLEYIPNIFSRSWNPRNDFRFQALTAADWLARKEIYRRQLEVVRLLHDAGVQFLAGTDLLNPYIYPGFSLHDELASLVGAGFTPAEALRAATLSPARYLGATDSLGTVAVGKVADLVVLDASPLADIRNVSRIHAVVANGRYLDAAARAQIIAGARKAVKDLDSPR